MKRADYEASLLLQYGSLLGFQKWDGLAPDMELWNVAKPLNGLVVGSTVTRETLLAAIKRAHPPRENRTVPVCSATLDSGLTVFVCAARYPGERGSVSITEVVEITSIQDMQGREVDVSDDDLAYLQREVERWLA